MKQNHWRRFLLWTPRILGILFALFISLFAFDVFAEGYGFWETLWALLMHLIPTALVGIATILAWRRPLWGGLLFCGLAAIYVIMTHGRLDWALIIAGPALLTGLLFLADAYTRRKTV
ncbi:MAG: hypothetical protein HUU23_00430 [Caldilineales bacterium]|nr:hypothetical protein [Caldilineales bacterium]